MLACMAALRLFFGVATPTETIFDRLFLFLVADHGSSCVPNPPVAQRRPRVCDRPLNRAPIRNSPSKSTIDRRRA